MTYIQQLDCSTWQFKSIPEFKRGTMSPVFADCGCGLGLTAPGETGEDSFMHEFNDVAADEITAYADELKKSGFRLTFCGASEQGNLYYQFASAEGYFNITYLKTIRRARFILDRCREVGLDTFGYSGGARLRGDTLFSQYSLHYDKMIKGTTCDCGMNYVFRLHDNSLVIIDGGEMEQSTDIAAADYMSFLHELTGTAKGEKMRVSLWICTHAHNDHCDFFSKLIRFYPDELAVERAAFNFPCSDNVGHSLSVADARRRLCEKYPGVEYIKLHAGAGFSIANARFKVLFSVEDSVGVDEEDIFSGMNATSLIFTVEADGGKVLFLADCCDINAEVLVKNYSRAEMACDYLQAAHHGINEIYEVYEHIDAGKVLLPQCRMNMETRFPHVFGHLCERFGENNIHLANDETVTFTLGSGKAPAVRAHVGCAYDGSEW